MYSEDVKWMSKVLIGVDPRAMGYRVSPTNTGDDMRRLQGSVAEVLRVARARRGHGQREAAATVGVTQAAWGKWERGEADPAARHLPAVADYCGVTVAELVGRDERTAHHDDHEDHNEVARLRAQLRAQSEQIEANRRRIEELTGTLLALLREQRPTGS
jgi:transcriptional regulator with XRE-family HTH domain